jgi:hypothetical protein
MKSLHRNILLLVLSVSLLLNLKCSSTVYKKNVNLADLIMSSNKKDLFIKTNDSLAYFFKADQYVLPLNYVKGEGIDVSSSIFSRQVFTKVKKTDSICIHWNDIAYSGYWEFPQDAANLSRVSFYIELIGTSSFNLEYRFKQPYSIRIGMGGGEISKHVLGGEILKYQLGIVSINRLFGKYDHLLELGGGLALGWVKTEYYSGGFLSGPSEIEKIDNYPPPFALISAGYRFQNLTGGFLFRLGTSVIAYYDKRIMSIWLPAISVGYTF